MHCRHCHHHHHSTDVENSDVYVIGDTPADIHCARPYHIKTIAVATGFHTTNDLAPEKPDYLFEDLGNVPEIMKLFE